MKYQHKLSVSYETEEVLCFFHGVSQQCLFHWKGKEEAGIAEGAGHLRK